MIRTDQASFPAGSSVLGRLGVRHSNTQSSLPDLLLHRWFFGELLSAASRASPASEMWLGSDAEAVLPTVEINLSIAMEVFTNVFESLLDLGVWDLVGSQTL